VNPLTIRPDRLERLRAICLALPEATEKEAWGDPTWRVRDRIFAMQKGNYEGGRPSLWLKAADGAQAMLVDADPERFFVPAYVGSKGWIGVYLDGEGLNWDMVRELVEESYRLIAPKRLAASLGAGDGDRASTPSSGPRGKRVTRDASKAPHSRRSRDSSKAPPSRR
jgi:predicted DNA-binding protein (MmcQ/YjbR family)